MNESTARTIKAFIVELNTAKIMQQAPARRVAEWVADLGAPMAKKLAAAGLIPQRDVKVISELGTFLDGYVKKRIDVKPATLEIWGQVARNLKDHFGADRDIATIGETDAESFKMYLIAEKLAPTTMHKRLQFAQMFFRAAKKQKLIVDNPFAEVSAKASIDKERQQYVSVEDTEKLLAIANPTWRTIIALGRFAGLRTPSETLSLRWAAVDWKQGRMIVDSPKTEHHPGKGSREVPIFTRLRPYLEEARKVARKDSVYVVDGNHRDAANTASGWRNCNPRTEFGRIIKRAKLEPWPRLFHALRSSYGTDLAREFPLHVVTAWIGNTPKIALRHYLMSTDEDAQRAALALQQLPELTRNKKKTRQLPMINQREMPGFAFRCPLKATENAERTGFVFYVVLTACALCRCATKAILALDLRLVICGHQRPRILTFGQDVWHTVSNFSRSRHLIFRMRFRNVSSRFI